MVKTSNDPQTQPLPLKFIRLLLQRPLLLWGGIWVSLILVATTATLGIMNPDSINQNRSALISSNPVEPDPASVKTDPTKTESAPADSGSAKTESAPADSNSANTDLVQGDPASTSSDSTKAPPASSTASKTVPESPNPSPTFTNVRQARTGSGVPLWVYSAIALGCAAGSIFLFLSFKHKQQSRQSHRRVRTKLRTATKTKQCSVPKKPISSESGVSSTEPVATTGSVIKEKVLVSVVPKDESHHLDWDGENLAEVMDVRKHYSLESLLRRR